MRKKEAEVAHRKVTQAGVAHQIEVGKEMLHLKAAEIKQKELLKIDPTQLKIRKLQHLFITPPVSTLIPVLNCPQICYWGHQLIILNQRL